MSSIPSDQIGPQAYPSPNLIGDLEAARVWLLWREEPKPDPTEKPDKVPYYAGGGKRHGTLDSPEDRARLVTYEEALAVYQRGAGAYAGLAIALGPDGNGGHWQGIDLDDIVDRQLTDIADLWTRGACGGLGYVEMSPSGAGLHILGYGRSFRFLSRNGSGIEAYAGGRFFTFTGKPVLADSSCQHYDLADYVEQALAPRHGAGRKATSSTDVEQVPVDAKTVTELRSALAHIRSDDRDVWVAMGHALKELGETGRGLWMDWSASSEKFNPRDAARKWDSFDPTRTAYQAVFAEAQRQGWVNPASNAAQLAPSASGSAPAVTPNITLEFAMESDTATVRLEYLLDPYLPRRCVVGFYGRGSTSKSSFLASLAAYISGVASTLWVSVEEPADWIKVRHISSGGADKTLAVGKAVESKRDQQGRVIASSFNVYEHLEPAMEQAKAGFLREAKPPLGLVTLDTGVGLTGWAKGENPNDDASVKKLLAYLQALAERYDVTIAIVGHANKGKPDHFADSVMGATAWTNSRACLSSTRATGARTMRS